MEDRLSNDSLLDSIPEVRDPTVDGVTLTHVTLIGVDDVKRRSRKVLEAWSKDERIYTLDEYVGTIVTLASLVFAALALVIEPYKYILGGVSAMSILFFWVTYRIAKAKHSVELRIGIISGFSVFLLFSTVFAAFFPYSSLAQLLPDWAVFVLGLCILLCMRGAVWALQREYFKGLAGRLWGWLSVEPVLWPGLISLGGDKVRKSVEELALTAYLPSVVYGMLSTASFFTIVISVSIMQHLAGLVVFAGFAAFCFYVVWDGLKESSYKAKLRSVGEAKREYRSLRSCSGGTNDD